MCVILDYFLLFFLSIQLDLVFVLSNPRIFTNQTTHSMFYKAIYLFAKTLFNIYQQVHVLLYSIFCF